jgi:BMFP domain-containing protein YqiC
MGQDDSHTHRPSSLFERLTQGDDPLFSQIDRNAKTLLQSALSRLDVVSREEFDAQTAVLQRTRERLEALEQQIVALNQALDTPTDAADG